MNFGLIENQFEKKSILSPLEPKFHEYWKKNQKLEIITWIFCGPVFLGCKENSLSLCKLTISIE